jgi:hypothetical protein
MLKYYFIFICVVMFSNTETKAQEYESPLKLIKKKPHVMLGIDNRRTHINGKHTVIFGAFTGLNFGEKLRLKIELSGTPFEIGQFDEVSPQNKFSRLFFISLGEEYDFYTIKNFVFTTYAQVGGGFNYYRFYNPAFIETSRGKLPIFPLEFGLQSAYLYNSWLRFKVGAGWRFVFPNPTNQYSGYYIKLGIGIHGRQLKEAIYKKKNSKIN